MLPQEVNRFPDSRLSFVLLTIVFRELSSAFMLACVILSSSDGIKEIFDLGIRVISPLYFVTFIRKLPLGKWKSFRDEIPISGFDSSVPNW